MRKVYSILACQLSLTAAFIAYVQYTESMRLFMMKNPALYIAAAVFSLILCISIVCCFGRRAPLNYILLAGFTVCETYMVGGITA